MNNIKDVYNVMKAKRDNTKLYYDHLAASAETDEDKNYCRQIKAEINTIEQCISLLTDWDYLEAIAYVYKIKVNKEVDK